MKEGHIALNKLVVRVTSRYDMQSWVVWYIGLSQLVKAKQKYWGMFETQKSGNKTSPGEIDLDIRTHASPKVGQDQVSITR